MLFKSRPAVYHAYFTVPHDLIAWSAKPFNYVPNYILYALNLHATFKIQKREEERKKGKERQKERKRSSLFEKPLIDYTADRTVYKCSPVLKSPERKDDIQLLEKYWVPQKLPQIYTVIAYICIEKVVWFETLCIYFFLKDGKKIIKRRNGKIAQNTWTKISAL